MEQGKYAAIIVCWLLGNGSLFSWNSMLTIEDYYMKLFEVIDVYSFLMLTFTAVCKIDTKAQFQFVSLP